MFKIPLLVILAMFVLTPDTTKADFYKYTDKKGNIVFTDDLSTIPENQRQTAEKYNEPPPSLQLQTPAEENTSRKDSDSDNAQPSSAIKEEIHLKKDALEKKQTELEQEYNALMEEKTNLEHQKLEAKGQQKIKAYNEQILQFTEKLNKYNEKRVTLEDEVSKYNDAIEKLGAKPEGQD